MNVAPVRLLAPEQDTAHHRQPGLRLVGDTSSWQVVGRVTEVIAASGKASGVAPWRGPFGPHVHLAHVPIPVPATARRRAVCNGQRVTLHLAVTS